MSEHESTSSRSSAVDAGGALFESLVDAAEEFRALVFRCAEHPAVVRDDVILTINLRRYGGTPTLELYVDAETKSGKGFAWCADIERSDDAWSIDRSVRMNDRDGQQVLIDLGTTELDSSHALAEQLPGLVTELIGTFDQVNLAA